MSLNLSSMGGRISGGYRLVPFFIMVALTLIAGSAFAASTLSITISPSTATIYAFNGQNAAFTVNMPSGYTLTSWDIGASKSYDSSGGLIQGCTVELGNGAGNTITLDYGAGIYTCYGTEDGYSGIPGNFSLTPAYAPFTISASAEPINGGSSITTLYNGTDAQLNIDPGLSVSNVVATTPVDSGQPVSLSAEVSGGHGPYDTQWYESSTDSNTVTTNKLLTSGSSPYTASYTPSGAGTIYFFFTATDGYDGQTVTTAPVAVTVNVALGVPSITAVTTPLDAGQATGSATVSWAGGVGPYAVSLYEGSSNSCSSDTTVANSITGYASNSVTLAFSAPSSPGTAYYCASVTDANKASTLSSASSVAVYPDLAISVAPAAMQSIDVGQTFNAITATITSGAANPGASIHWYGSSTSPCTSSAIPTGITTNSFSRSFSLPGTTYYCAVATDSEGGSAYSGTVEIQVNTALSFESQPNSTAYIDTNQYLTLNAVATGGTGSYAWQWYNGGTPLLSGTGATASYTMQAGTGTGSTNPFYVVFTDSGTSAGASPTANIVSGGTVVTMNSMPAISVQLAPSEVLDTGQTYEYGVAAAGGTGALTYAWSLPPGITAASGCSASDATCTVQASSAASGSVTVTVGDHSQGYAGEGSTPYPSSSSFIAFVAAPTVSFTQSNVSLDSGQYETLTASVSNGIGPFTINILNESGSPPYPAMGALTVQAPGGSNSITFQSNAVGQFFYQATATDFGSNTPYGFQSGIPVIYVASAPTVAIAPINAILDVGQYASFIGTVSGGTGSKYPGGYFSLSLVDTATGNVVASNTIQLAGNGILSFQTSGLSHDVFNIMATDHGTTTPYAFGSASSTVTINPALSAAVTSPKYFTIINVGQNITVAAATSNGTPPYTYSWASTCPGFASANTASFVYAPAAATDSCYFQANVGDSATTPASYAANSQTIAVESSSANGITVSSNTMSGNVVIDDEGMDGIVFTLVQNATTKGGSASFTVANVTSATVPGLSNYKLLFAANVVATPSAVGDVIVAAPYPCSVSASSIAPYQLLNGTWVPITPFTVNASACTLSFAINADPTFATMQYSPTGSSPSTGVSGGSSAGSSAGPTKPVVVPYTNATAKGYHIYNMTRDNSETLLLNGTNYLIVQNFITPTSAGVTVNGASHTIDNGQTTGIGGGAYLNLANITYVPIQQSASYNFYEAIASQTPAKNTSVSTNSTTAPTVATTAAPTTTAAAATTSTPVQQQANSGATSVPALDLEAIGVIVVVVVIGGVIYASVRARKRHARK